MMIFQDCHWKNVVLWLSVGNYNIGCTANTTMPKRNHIIKIYSSGRKLQSTLSNSSSLGDRKYVRITKSSNYRELNYRGSLLGDFQGTRKFCSN